MSRLCSTARIRNQDSQSPGMCDDANTVVWDKRDLGHDNWDHSVMVPLADAPCLLDPSTPGTLEHTLLGEPSATSQQGTHDWREADVAVSLGRGAMDCSSQNTGVASSSRLTASARQRICTPDPLIADQMVMGHRETVAQLCISYHTRGFACCKSGAHLRHRPH